MTDQGGSSTAVPDFQSIVLPLLDLGADSQEHSLRGAIESLVEKDWLGLDFVYIQAKPKGFRKTLWVWGGGTVTSPSPLAYGQYYHIYNRGNNRQNLFFERRNYRHFSALHARHIEPVADTFAYCLLPNHFHLLVYVKTVEEQEETHRVQTLGVSETLTILDAFRPRKPSQQFGNLFNAYTKAVNKAYGRTGSLFENPFGRKPVTSDAYFTQLIAYIHHNPQKHGFVADYRDWDFSSYQAMLAQKPTRLKRDAVLGWFDGVAGFQAAHCREANERLIAPLIAEDYT